MEKGGLPRIVASTQKRHAWMEVESDVVELLKPMERDARDHSTTLNVRPAFLSARDKASQASNRTSATAPKAVADLGQL
jgi:hypothetical protein